MRLASKLEAKFALYWKGCGGPELATEFPFFVTRKWRFDFAHLQTRTAFEIEGGIWTNSRHTRGQGFSNDCEKYNTAVLCGWRVFRLTGKMITTSYVTELIRNLGPHVSEGHHD